MAENSYEVSNAQELRRFGILRGRMIAEDILLPDIGTKKSLYSYLLPSNEIIEDDIDMEDVFLVQAHQHEMEDRDRFPFVQHARIIDARPDKDFAWEAFLNGVDEGIKQILEEKMATVNFEEVYP